MGSITCPVFADEHGDLSIFDSVGSMDAYVEAIDVENGEYEFYDAIGQRLKAQIKTHDGHVTFQVDADRPANPEHLEALLRDYFKRLPGHLDDFKARAEAAESLASLVALRQELARRPRRRFLSRLLRRSPRD